ncbi:MAG: hypothetical protein ACRD16_16230 [Thermoanaerobaculia bacterium]
MGVLRPLAFGLGLSAAIVGVAAFAPGTAPRPGLAGPPAGSSTTSPPPRRPRVHSFVGEVVEVQAAQQKLIVRETLRDGSPKTTTFLTNARTVVVRGADAAGLADVHANDHVTIKYREDASKNKEAVTIRITPSAAPKPTK